MLYPNDADGNAIRANLAPLLTAQGFTIVDPGPYEDGTTDHSAQIATFKREKCEIFNSFPIPPDFAAFWRQATQQGYARQVKICQTAKTGLFPSQIEALGRIGFNISSAAYWHKAFPYKSPLTGVGGTELADGYEQSSGKRWTQQLGASLSLLDAGFAALQASGNPGDKAAVAKALAEGADGRRLGGFHHRPGAQLGGRSDHRHAMGQGGRGRQIQAGLRGDRARDQPERAGRRQAAALLGIACGPDPRRGRHRQAVRRA